MIYDGLCIEALIEAGLDDVLAGDTRAVHVSDQEGG